MPPLISILFYSLIVLVLLLVLFSGSIMSRVDEPKFTVLKSDGPFSVREYAPMIVAEVEVSGERKEALRQGFRLIANYIFGQNTAQEKIAMTSPVTQRTEEKIPMTAPVIQQSSGTSWKVSFVMPAKYTLETLPTPNNPQVKILSVPSKRLGVIRFSGLYDDQQLKTEKEALLHYLLKHQLVPVGDPITAYYNPPWTLPFLRRNEMLVELD